MSLDLAQKGFQSLSSEELESYLRALWAMQLKLDGGEAIDNSAEFMSLGGQSVDLFRMLARLEEDFDLEVDFDDFFEEPTLNSLLKLLISCR